MKYGDFLDISEKLDVIRIPAVFIVHGEYGEIVLLQSSLELYTVLANHTNYEILNFLGAFGMLRGVT